MKPVLSKIICPSLYEIDLWHTQKNLDEFPIFSTSPLPAPTSMMIQYPSSVSDIIGGPHLDNINRLNKSISKIEKSMYFIYQFRSHTIGLENQINNKNLTIDQYSPDIIQMIQKYKIVLDDLSKSAQSAIETLVDILTTESIWATEQYFNELIGSICFFIYRLFTFIYLCMTKKDISVDMAAFNRLICENDDLTLLNSLAQQFENPEFFKGQIYQLLSEKSIQLPQIQTLFGIFWRYMKESQEPLQAEIFTSHITSLLFFIDLQNHFSGNQIKIPDDIFQFLHSYRQKHPSLILLYDFSMNYEEFIGNSVFSEDASSRSSRINLSTMFKKMFSSSTDNQLQIEEKSLYSNEVLTKQYYHLFLKLLERLKNKENPTKEQSLELFRFVTSILSETSRAIHSVNELIISKKVNNQGFEEIEDSIKVEISHILLFSLKYHKVLIDQYKMIYSLLSDYIFSTVYLFISNVFEELRTNSSTAFDRNKAELEFIEKFNQIDNWSASTQIYLLNVLRCSLQIGIQNEPKSTGLFSKASGFSAGDKESIRNFLKASQYFIPILNLEEEIRKSFDLSPLYFKEYSSYSLPNSFIQYFINRASTQNKLNKHVFEFLSIYNSAAYSAVKIINSQNMYEEIKQESVLVLNYLAKKFIKIAFDSTQKVTTARYIENHTKQKSRLDQQAVKFVANVSLLLQQGQISLVGQNINLKGIFSDNMRIHFIDHLSFLVDAFEKYGLCVIFAFSSMIDIYRNMHTRFFDLGLELTPFNDLLQEVTQSGSPQTFKSKLFDIAYSHLFNMILSEFSFYSFPYRFFPTKEIPGLVQFIETNKNIIPFECFTPSLMYVTVNHFKELFKFLTNGCMVILINHLRTAINELFKQFVDCYSKVKKIVYRIQDRPLQLGCFNFFSEFDSRYRKLLVEKDVSDLFSLLKQIGNAIAIAEMLDDTFSLKKSSELQYLAFLFGCKPVDETNELVNLPQLDETFDDLFELNKEFQESGNSFEWEEITREEVVEEEEDVDSDSGNQTTPSHPKPQPYIYHFSSTSSQPFQQNENRKLIVAPKKELILQPFKSLIISDFEKIILSYKAVFVEESANVLDFMSLTGFGAKWSVLEFVFCLMESERKDKGSIHLYGEGVSVASSLILSILQQVPMSRAFSICEKIDILYKMDSDLPKEILIKFIDGYHYIKASSQSATAKFDPILTSLQQQTDI